MKTKIKLKSTTALLLLATLPLFWYCTNEDVVPKKGDVSFAFSHNVNQDNSSGRVSTINTPAFIKYAVKNSAGEVTTDVVPVYPFGTSYVSDRQTFQTGHYTLLEYYVLNAENEILFAAALEGSPFAKLVTQTLPLPFQVSQEQTTAVNPEVLPVTNETSPEDFGYVKWGYQVAAMLVKFKLPVHSDIVPFFHAATLKITQGDYTREVSFKGSPSTELYATTLVKHGKPVTISLAVFALGMYNERYNYLSDDVLYRTSNSQFEFTQTVPAILSGNFSFPEFKHKLGNGWDFRSAEITSFGDNGSWSTVKYQNGENCNRYVTITTSETSFNYNYSDFMVTDKIVWSGFDYDYGSSMIKGVTGSFGQPVCADGTCTLTADLNFINSETTKYNEYAAACEENEWVMFDALTRLTTTQNGKKSRVNTYFKLEKDVEVTVPGGRKKSSDLTHSDPVREQYLKR